MLAWLPTYFVDTLAVDLMHASQTALLPPLAGIAASAIAGVGAALGSERTLACPRCVAVSSPNQPPLRFWPCSVSMLTAVLHCPPPFPLCPGPAADALVGKGLPVATVRKLAQCVAFLVPAALLLAMGNPDVEESSNLTIACITLALGISSFSLAGLYCTHQVRSGRQRCIVDAICKASV